MNFAPGTFKLFFFIFLFYWGQGLGQRPGVDLVVSNPQIYNHSISPGDAVHLWCKIRNIGLARAPFSFAGVFLSSDPIKDSLDLFLAYSYCDTIGPGDSVNTSSYFTLPYNTSYGNYYIIAETDFNKTVNEVIEDNNSVAIPLNVSPVIIDFFTRSSDSLPLIFVPGQNPQLSFILKNNGTTPSQTRIMYFLSDDPFWSNDDLMLQTNSQNYYLKGNDSLSIRRNIEIPRLLDTGNYYVLIFTDFYETVQEVNEINNLTSLPISVVEMAADIFPDSLEVTPSVVPGLASVNIKFKLRNLGSTPTNNMVSTTFYISLDTIFDSKDLSFPYDNGFSGGVLGANESVEINTSRYIGLLPGNYYLIVYADGENEIRETNENNNILYFPISVIPSSVDLEIVNASLAPGPLYPGEQKLVSWVIKNNGSTLSTYSNVGLFLSNDTLWSSEDEYLGSTGNNNIEAGDTISLSYMIHIPARTIPGTKYILFYADYSKNITETNESNNIKTLMVSVAQPSFDLRAETYSLSPLKDQPWRRNYS